MEVTIVVDIDVEVDISLDTQETYFKGDTLHLWERIIAWLPEPAEIE